jgi:hypothetical protein
MNKSWDYKKFNYRFFHTTINNVTWYLYRNNDTYFFSTDDPAHGEPTNIPDGYEVKIDKTTNKPILIKKISVGDAVDDFFANETDDKKEKTKKSAKKKRKLPSEMRDRYHRWKY